MVKTTNESKPSPALKAKEKEEKRRKAISPLLTVVEITVKKKNENATFRDSITDILSIEKMVDDNKLFELYANSFYKKLDIDEFILPTSGKKKGISVSKEKASDKLNTHPEKCLIEGLIIGGVFGRPRNARKLKAKHKSKEVNTDDVITDDYYVMIYLPMNHYKGYMLLQYYPDVTIKSELQEFIRKTLKRKNSGYDVLFTYYSDEELNKSFENNCILDHLSFSSTFVNEDVGDDIFTEKENDGLVLKIEASTFAKNPIPYNQISDFFQKIRKICCNEKKIKDYEKQRVTVKNTETGKTTTFDIDENMKIRPITYLCDKISVSEDGIPNFVELKSHCSKELEKIKKAKLPGYGKVTTC